MSAGSLSVDAKSAAEPEWKYDIVHYAVGLRGYCVNAFQWSTHDRVIIVTRSRVWSIPLPTDGKTPPACAFDSKAIAVDVGGKMQVLRFGTTDAQNSIEEKLVKTYLKSTVPVRRMHDLRMTDANRDSIVDKVLIPTLLASTWSKASMCALANYTNSLR